MHTPGLKAVLRPRLTVSQREAQGATLLINAITSVRDSANGKGRDDHARTTASRQNQAPPVVSAVACLVGSALSRLVASLSVVAFFALNNLPAALWIICRLVACHSNFHLLLY